MAEKPGAWLKEKAHKELSQGYPTRAIAYAILALYDLLANLDRATVFNFGKERGKHGQVPGC